MIFQRLTLLLLFILISLPSAFARKPAVEDFVGVEPQDYSRTPQGTEVLFDFGNTIKANPQNTQNNNVTTTLVLLSFILLPFAMWFGITKSVNPKHEEEEENVQMAEVKNLSDYQNKDDNQEDVKKAS
jgi:hypothetical protein